MKGYWILVVMVIMVVTGCGVSDLEAYQEAMDATESYESGVIETDMSIELTFNDRDMTFEEIRELSYFEVIDTRSRVTFDNTGDLRRSVVEGYYNFGGLGFDMIFYFDGDDMLLKLPIMDKYLDIESQETDMVEQDYEEQEAAFKILLDTWNQVLMEEDVVSGNRAYVMTDRGQLKTTTYSLSMDQEQFEVMMGALLEVIEDQGLVEAFLEDGRVVADYDISPEEVQDQLAAMLEDLSLESFEGVAYVDFDGRLVQEEFDLTLINEGAAPGQVATMAISYYTMYDQLGEAVEITIPQITEEDLLDISTDGSLEEFFPEELFN